MAIMRFIKKTASPDFFEKCKEKLPESPSWKNFTENKELSDCKKKLHEYLMGEQSHLCIYCERKIESNNSHIEHIKPKNPQSGYPADTFSYENLVSSCNGVLCDLSQKSSYDPEDVHSCGHKKDDLFDDEKFLNPVQETSIENHFIYDKVTGKILPSTKEGKENEKAKYTIQLLNLDCIRLNNERIHARTALFQFLNNSKNSEFQKLTATEQIHRIVYGKRIPAFVSFLKFYFHTNSTMRSV